LWDLILVRENICEFKEEDRPSCCFKSECSGDLKLEMNASLQLVATWFALVGGYILYFSFGVELWRLLKIAAARQEEFTPRAKYSKIVLGKYVVHGAYLMTGSSFSDGRCPLL
jgi:hypothetical protein